MGQDRVGNSNNSWLRRATEEGTKEEMKAGLH